MTSWTTTRAISLLLAGALLVAPMGAFAQGTPAATGSADKRNAFVEKRIEQLRSEIKITPGEQKSFDDFSSVMRQNAMQMNEAVQKGTALPANATAVDRLQTYTEMSQVHAQNMLQLSSAFSVFYNTLTPEQKQVVDASFTQQAQARQAQARRGAKS